MKPDQERVRGLLTDTVTLLCKNGLQYSKELKVQGLLGITLDNDDVFVVHINEIFDGLVGGQVTAIQPGDSINSAIVAADSATQPTEREQITVKSRKSTPHKHGVPRTSSPMTLHGSSKRKASLKPPQMRIKKEEDDDDVVLLDNAKSEPNHTSEFVPTATDLSGDGDREAMRMSYGGATLSELDQDSPPAKRRAGESVNKSGDAFTEQSESGAPFITGIVHNNTDADILGNTSSLDGSQLSGVGQMEGQVGFDNAPGCSAWDASQVADGNGEDPTDPGSQDSMYLVVQPEEHPVGSPQTVIKTEPTDNDSQYPGLGGTESPDLQFNVKKVFQQFLENPNDPPEESSVPDMKPMPYTMSVCDFSKLSQDVLYQSMGDVALKYQVLLLPGPVLSQRTVRQLCKTKIPGLTKECVRQIFDELVEEGFGIKMVYEKGDLFVKRVPDKFEVKGRHRNFAILNGVVPFILYCCRFYSQ